ncbi:nickase [Leuconostoc falkenbergense]|uniref:MobQ family relaxase n=1 Tax=Leuconostoc falkenbergense TaxID=2766470 RepID=UPI0021AA0E75|nr:MobQ family relaxase [Leuconostoc falkenbergense]MCT4410923.1 nickase [Leuconostoc falkenbergense]
MAIFHMNFSNISGGNGRSAVASASYRSGEKLHSDAENKNYFYERVVMPESFILLPENAPEWASDREVLWNEVEAIDRKVNSRYAKEFNVALPVELTNDEQKELLTRYVQETFVNNGMVADVAIHRDNADNPHAHVMLTNRPFNADGTWGQKSKTEYILDENGNKTRTEKGNIRQRKIWLVDWDKQGKVQEWRKGWADAVNRTFEQKNMPERISEKTLEEQGIDGLPTQHVGVNRNKKERQEYNDLAIENRSDIAKLKNLDEKIYNEQRVQTLQRHLSFNEKKMVANFSRELHTFISLENLDDKQRMLFNWKNSILIKQAIGQDMNEQLVKFNEQKYSLENANRLMDKVVDRTMKSIYPSVDIDSLTMAEKRELIKETDSENRIFSSEEIDTRLKAIRADILNKQILTFTKRPFTSWVMLENQQATIIENVENIISQKGYSFADIERSKGLIIQDFNSDEQDILKRNIKDFETVNQVKNVVETQYNGVLEKVFPNIAKDQLSMVEKEKIYTAIIFTNPDLKTISEKELMDIVENPPTQFSTREHRQGISYLTGVIKIEDIQNQHLVRILKNDGAKQLFIGEATKDPQISNDEIERVKKAMQQSGGKYENYRKDQLKDYQSVNYRETTPAEYMKNLFSNTVTKFLYSNDTKRQHDLKETEWEMEKKKRQNEKTGGRGM